MMEVLKAKVEQLEKDMINMRLEHQREIQTVKEEQKAQAERIRSSELTVNKIEIIVAGLEKTWQTLETKLDKVIDGGSKGMQTVAMEILKWSAVIIVAILAAKIFLK